MFSLNDNVSSYDKFKIRPRVFRDVSKVDMSTSMFGQKVGLCYGG